MPQTWFITGTSTGFGRELTEQLLAAGHRVAATLRYPEQLDALRAQYGDQVWVRALDVTDLDQLDAVVVEAFAELDRIDVVVSNAGYGLFGTLEELTREQVERQLDTNVLGSIELARVALPYLRAQGGGKLIQISSMGGQFALPGMPLYHATKWAVEGLFESLRQDVAPLGIQTCLVETGSARTDFGGRSSAIGEAVDAYSDTPAGAIRRMIGTRTTESVPGDAAKMATAIIVAAQQAQLPQRLLLGSDAYNNVRKALTDRLAFAESQKDLAYSTDADDYAPAGAVR